MPADIADWIWRRIEDAQEGVGALQDRAAGYLLEPTVRLGVTGLSRAGKTVFITSLVANLLRRGRMQGLSAEAEGRIEAAILAPQPDLDAPRFDYESHLADLYAAEPRWPESTRSLAQLRVSIRFQPTGLISAVTGASTLHLDIIDYPGEWLLDLPLMSKRYAEWSVEAIAQAQARPEQSRAFLDWARSVDPAAEFEEETAKTGARLYTEYLKASRKAGFYGLAPGRFLLPGDLEGAPAVTFAPLPAPANAIRRGLYAEMQRRFEGYKSHVVRPFFRDHFARLDRQIVLVDALGAISNGPEAAKDLHKTLTEILGVFRPGRRSWLAGLFGSALLGRRIDRVLLAVTKADHIHHTAHPALASFVSDLLATSIDRAAFRGAKVEAMALASLRATVEEEMRQGGETLPAVRGRLLDGGETRLFPGEPPKSLGDVIDGRWKAEDFDARPFAPPRLERRPGEGPPHMRLDRALDWLIGDKLS